MGVGGGQWMGGHYINIYIYIYIMYIIYIQLFQHLMKVKVFGLARDTSRGGGVHCSPGSGFSGGESRD